MWKNIYAKLCHFAGGQFISITKQGGAINFPAAFRAFAGITDEYKFVQLLIDNEKFRLGFNFHKTKEEGDFTISKSRSKKYCIFIKSIGQRYENKWLSKSRGRFDPYKEGNLWVIDCRPTFEHRKKRGDTVDDDIIGIYRLKDNQGTIVYIGEGRINQRLQEHNKKDWNYSCFEYSAVPNKEDVVKWEYEFIESFKSENDGHRPCYNLIDGHHPKNGNE